MKKYPIEITEKNYWKYWLMATIVIFTIVIVFGIWGVFDDPPRTVNPATSRQTGSGAAANAADR